MSEALNKRLCVILNEFLKFVASHDPETELAEQEFERFKNINEHKIQVLRIRSKLTFELSLNLFVIEIESYLSDLNLQDVDETTRKFLLNCLNFECFKRNVIIFDFVKRYVEYCINIPDFEFESAHDNYNLRTLETWFDRRRRAEHPRLNPYVMPRYLVRDDEHPKQAIMWYFERITT